MQRRQFIAAPLVLGLPELALASESVAQRLRATTGAGNGAVLMFRHALAPGTFDPPEFALGNCATQRNLNEQGREQSRQIGAWFATRQLQPKRVRSSPWCRCVDTARLAFGDNRDGSGLAWAALGSPRGSSEATNASSLKQLQAALKAVVQQGAGFEVWVSHNFVFNGWLGASARTGEALLLGLKPDGKPQVLDRFDTLAT